MNYAAELERRMREKGAAEAYRKLAAVSRPGLLLLKKTETVYVKQPSKFFGLFRPKPVEELRALPIVTGESRIGGLPDVPPAFNWPMWQNAPLPFLAQINCAQVAAYREETLLPEKGMLYFFHPLEVCEVDFSEEMVPSVVYAPEANNLEPAFDPSRSGSEIEILPAYPVDFLPIQTFPHNESPEYEELGLSEEESELVYESVSQIQLELTGVSGFHVLGGYPRSIQGDVMDELGLIDEMVQREASGGVSQEAEKEEAGMRLLLQIDTDDDVNMEWGDGGSLYYGMKEKDLLACRFQNAVVTMQCC